MTRWPILLPLLLLAGCGSRDRGDANNAADALPPELMPNMAAVEASSAAHVQALIDQALPAAVPDAKTAQYRNVRAGAGGAACGEVAGKTTHGWVPFVVPPSGTAVVGTGAKIDYANPSDILADAWIRWCATPEELNTVAAEIHKARPDLLPGNLAAPVPDVPPPQPVAEAPPARPSAPPPPPQISSFFNSVARGK
jgi:hypothetical protein